MLLILYLLIIMLAMVSAQGIQQLQHLQSDPDMFRCRSCPPDHDTPKVSSDSSEHKFEYKDEDDGQVKVCEKGQTCLAKYCILVSAKQECQDVHIWEVWPGSPTARPWWVGRSVHALQPDEDPNEIIERASTKPGLGVVSTDEGRSQQERTRLTTHPLDVGSKEATTIHNSPT
ncbi:uncharacterized protein LOC120278220 [Dioscorea cayenensis subsp. rotundata]|uniref:Uncharacterized protein LOC120278220 n=1 Tax=Dioscorea cayennensis subsp. rotundata TaxID=55577 RepID=A0AB40CP19_DIOCR|nr:uncharacterized protein LOC120278220 [Dioscorea cayenensis subsp. rotundata]